MKIVRGSYHSTKNKKIKIKYNKNILGAEASTNTSTCNWWSKKACTINGWFYKGAVINRKKWFGIAEESFGGQLMQLQKSFKNKFYIKATQNFLWSSSKPKQNIIPRKSNDYNNRKCYLYLSKKLEVSLYEGNNLVNKNRISFSNTVIQISSCYSFFFLKLKMASLLKKTLLLNLRWLFRFWSDSV